VAVADAAFPAGAAALVVIVAAIVVVTTAVIASHAGNYQKAAVSGKQTVIGPVVDSFATVTAAIRRTNVPKLIWNWRVEVFRKTSGPQ